MDLPKRELSTTADSALASSEDLLLKHQTQVTRLKRHFQRDLRSVIETELRKASEERRLLEKRQRHAQRLQQLEEESTLIRHASRLTLS